MTRLSPLSVLKAHAYGNDFLFVRDDEAGDAPAALARCLCDRHTGVGADGLILYRPTPRGAAMQLYNADGSLSEVSGNGVRCLAALVLREWEAAGGARAGEVVIDTVAGEKRLTPLGGEGGRRAFRAAMGAPAGVRQVTLDVSGERLTVAALAVGNPQCVVLGGPLDEGRMHRLGPALERHSYFPARTNVEFAEVLAPDRIRILIWERGVGPTRSSGTGSCAAAVAAATFGSAGRDVEVMAPGGVQRVEWREDGLYLTGWAELLFTASWESGTRE